MGEAGQMSHVPTVPTAQADAGSRTHQKQADEGAHTVPQRPLVLVLEHLWLQKLQDPQHVQEEGQVVLLAELLEVEVGAAVKERSDHGQVPGDDQERSLVHAPRNPAPLPGPAGNPHSGTRQAGTTQLPHGVWGLQTCPLASWPPCLSHLIPCL